jgi:hypothetical protein
VVHRCTDAQELGDLVGGQLIEGAQYEGLTIDVGQLIEGGARLLGEQLPTGDLVAPARDLQVCRCCHCWPFPSKATRSVRRRTQLTVFCYQPATTPSRSTVISADL